jgi:hypothetical protein
MLRAEQLVEIGTPSAKPTVREGHTYWPQWTTWPFLMSDGKNSWNGLMDEEEYNIYLAEKVILEQLKLIPMKPETRRALLDAIEKYGSEREEKGREDVREDWAESDAGASV